MVVAILGLDLYHTTQSVPGIIWKLGIAPVEIPLMAEECVFNEAARWMCNLLVFGVPAWQWVTMVCVLLCIGNGENTAISNHAMMS